jgi:hypothetical protein
VRRSASRILEMLQNVNAFLGLPVGAAAGSLYFLLAQIDGHEGAATVAASCQRCGFFTAARACTSRDRPVSRMIADWRGIWHAREPERLKGRMWA